MIIQRFGKLQIGSYCIEYDLAIWGMINNNLYYNDYSMSICSYFINKSMNSSGLLPYFHIEFHAYYSVKNNSFNLQYCIYHTSNILQVVPICAFHVSFIKWLSLALKWRLVELVISVIFNIKYFKVSCYIEIKKRHCNILSCHL